MSQLTDWLMPWRKPMREARDSAAEARAGLQRLLEQIEAPPAPEPPVPRVKLNGQCWLMDIEGREIDGPVPVYGYREGSKLFWRAEFEVQHDNPFLEKRMTWAGEKWGCRPRRFRLELDAGHLGTFEHRGWCNPERGPTWAPWAPVGDTIILDADVELLAEDAPPPLPLPPVEPLTPEELEARPYETEGKYDD